MDAIYIYSILLADYVDFILYQGSTVESKYLGMFLGNLPRSSKVFGHTWNGHKISGQIQTAFKQKFVNFREMVGSLRPAIFVRIFTNVEL